MKVLAIGRSARLHKFYDVSHLNWFPMERDCKLICQNNTNATEVNVIEKSKIDLCISKINSNYYVAGIEFYKGSQ